MSLHPGGTGPSLASRVAKGAAIMGFTRLAARLLGLISTVVLARLLMPEDFGVVAIAMSYIHFLGGISDLNFEKALITHNDPGDDEFNTAWTLNLLRGVGLALIVLISAFVLPTLLDEPRLKAIIATLAVLPVLEGLVNTRFVIFEKNIDFSRQMILTVGTKILTVATTIALAFVIGNYWVLIIGMLLGTASQVAFSFILVPHRPRLTLVEHRGLVSFSIWLMGANFFNSISRQMDKLIVAALLGTKMTGIYHVGKELVLIPTTEMIGPLNRALHPTFATVYNAGGDLRDKALQSAEILAACALPIGLGFAMLAPELVMIIFGEKWMGAVPVLQILTPILAIERIATVADSVAMALSRTRSIFMRQMILSICDLVLLTVGGLLWGFYGILAAAALSKLITLGLNLQMLDKLLGTPVHLYLFRMRRSLLAAFAMVAMLLLAGQELWFDGMNIFLMAIAKILLGGVTYVSMHLLAWRMEGCPFGFETRVLTVVKGRLSNRFGTVG